MAVFEFLPQRIADRPWQARLHAFGVLALAAVVDNVL